jgi:hypothetical protein
MVLLLAPAGCLLVTDRFVAAIEDGFLQDAHTQVQRLDRIVEMYPPRLAHMKNAPRILQLKKLGDGGSVAATVCGPVENPYRPFFERLITRCDQWAMLRKARAAAFIGVLASLAAMALLLMARMSVQAFERTQLAPGSWAMWFSVRGFQLVLLAQVALSLLGFRPLLLPLVGRPLYAGAILALAWILVFWVEKLAVSAFIQPGKLKGVQGRSQRSRSARSEPQFVARP